MTVNVIIPTYKPDEKLDRCLRMLRIQTLQPEKILLVNTEKELFSSRVFETLPQGEILHIKKEEFDHGGTRNLAASLCDCDIILLLTQDAIPADERLIERLVEAFRDEDVCAAYGRQMADPRDNPLESYTRQFNYPPGSRIKSKEDLPLLGIKTFFCSNVCAAYRKSVYDELGGFPLHTIFNEDMIFASRLIESGKKIAYVAEARVWHWHNYSPAQQLQRNFDLAVSQVDHGGLFLKVKSESEGIKLVKKTMLHFLKKGRLGLIPAVVLQNGAKFVGYRLGKRYRKLPLWLVKKISMNKTYWDS